jgi:CheY-like chemotaxis protein/transcriptional regulator with XRE-family HTH domain
MNDTHFDPPRYEGYTRSTDTTTEYSPIDRELSARIHAQRCIAGLSLQALADATRLTVSNLSEIEQGRAILPASMVPRLASTLGKSIEWFYSPLVRRTPFVHSPDVSSSGYDTTPGAVSAVYADQLLTIQAVDWSNQTGSTHMTIPDMARKSGRVLLVDDTPDVLVSIGAFLEGAGLQVITAQNTEDALRIVLDDERLDAIITDYAMPGSTGADLLMQVADIRPALPRMLITAYAEAISLQDLPDRTVILGKPFRRKVLIDKVMALINAESLVLVNT